MHLLFGLGTSNIVLDVLVVDKSFFLLCCFLSWNKLILKHVNEGIHINFQLHLLNIFNKNFITWKAILTTDDNIAFDHSFPLTCH